jgi:hypothetical protein
MPAYRFCGRLFGSRTRSAYTPSGTETPPRVPDSGREWPGQGLTISIPVGGVVFMKCEHARLNLDQQTVSDETVESHPHRLGTRLDAAGGKHRSDIVRANGPAALANEFVNRLP